MTNRTDSGAGWTIASVASILLGAVAALMSLGGEAGQLVADLYNHFQIQLGAQGDVIITGTVVAIGVACAIVGLLGRAPWLAVIGIVVNGFALLLAVLISGAE